MRKIRSFPVGLLFCFTVTLVSAQPITGIPLPKAPLATTLTQEELEVATKLAQIQDAQDKWETAQLNLIQSKLLRLGVPKMNTDSIENSLQKRAYPGYLVGFSANHGQPQWSTHIIRRDIFTICLEREENFFEDLSVTGAPLLAQYRSSGFQRGHMAPAADFRWSPKASVASNTLTNISPQSKALNEGLWAKLEVSIRQYLRVRDSLSELIVVTGPVIDAGLAKLNGSLSSHISIPKQFFKVVVNFQEQQGYAFLIEADAADVTDGQLASTLRKRAMSIDSLEKQIGINFFPNLTTVQEKNIESKLDMDSWFAIPGVSTGRMTLPISDPILLGNASNTAKITAENFKNVKAVVGTVTKVSVGASGGMVLSLDDSPANHPLEILIQKRDTQKFTQPTLADMLGHVVRVEGNLSENGNGFKISIRDAKKLMVLD
ncbi:MAG: DNA/RNA non-specific endonuclease [Bacteroidota bacterium]